MYSSFDFNAELRQLASEFFLPQQIPEGHDQGSVRVNNGITGSSYSPSHSV